MVSTTFIIAVSTGLLALVIIALLGAKLVGLVVIKEAKAPAATAAGALPAADNELA